MAVAPKAFGVAIPLAFAGDTPATTVPALVDFDHVCIYMHHSKIDPVVGSGQRAAHSSKAHRDRKRVKIGPAKRSSLQLGNAPCIRLDVREDQWYLRLSDRLRCTSCHAEF